MRIGFLGLGAMGQRMAARLVARGWDVAAWSRSRVHPPELDRVAVHSPEVAARGSDVVISMVSDDEASAAVWEGGALAALERRAIAIECSTVTPSRAIALAARVHERGGRFLDAPVVGSRPQAEAGALVFLVGGEPATVSDARPIFEAMGSAVHHLGANSVGAKTKLVVNALFGVQVALLAELIGFARSAGLDSTALVALLATLPVTSPAANAAGAAMLAGRHSPMFPVRLVEKDLRYILGAARAVGRELPVAGAARDAFARALERGLGEANLTAVGSEIGGRTPTAG